MIVALFQDFTKQHLLEEELEKQNEQLQNALEAQYLLNLLCHHADALMVTLLQIQAKIKGVMKATPDYKDFQFLYLNPTFMKMHPKYKLNTEASKCMSREDWKSTLDRLVLSKSAGSGVTLSRERLLEDEWYVMNVTYLRDDIFIFTSQNVSVIKSLQEELRQNQLQLEDTVERRTRELQDALQVKSRFLAIMSHGM
jgi:hypothetical protein